MIFQITDDLLDYLGNEQILGKKIGVDFFEGKVTLPLILLNQFSYAFDQEDLILKSIQNRSEKEFNLIKNLIIRYSIESKIEEIIKELYQEIMIINKIDLNVNLKENIIELMGFLVKRTF